MGISMDATLAVATTMIGKQLARFLAMHAPRRPRSNATFKKSLIVLNVRTVMQVRKMSPMAIRVNVKRVFEENGKPWLLIAQIQRTWIASCFQRRIKNAVQPVMSVKQVRKTSPIRVNAKRVFKDNGKPRLLLAKIQPARRGT
jgi:hypothetical protein